jgi:hypothetical protein
LISPSSVNIAARGTIRWHRHHNAGIDIIPATSSLSSKVQIGT